MVLVVFVIVVVVVAVVVMTRKAFLWGISSDLYIQESFIAPLL